MPRTTLHQLGEKVRRKRGDQRVRQVAQEIGIGAATLTRVEHGHLPDLETFGKICQWLKIDPASLLGVSVAKPRHERGKDAVISAHFRVDQTTSPELAEALAEMILKAQEKLAAESS